MKRGIRAVDIWMDYLMLASKAFHLFSDMGTTLISHDFDMKIQTFISTPVFIYVAQGF